jgi:hypothetical protein
VPRQKQNRGKLALYTLGSALALAVLWLGGTSLHSLYHGTGELYVGRATDTKAVAYTQHCTRVGPVSVDGFGYWWDCSAAVNTADGRWADITTHGSMLTAADIGRKTNMIESCGTSDHRDCTYGRPIAWDRAFTFGLALFAIVERGAEIIFGVAFILSLGYLIFGEARGIAWFKRHPRVTAFLRGQPDTRRSTRPLPATPRPPVGDSTTQPPATAYPDQLDTPPATGL